MTSFTAPHASIDNEYGFSSKDGAVPLFYCDNSLTQIENINPSVEEFEHDYPGESLFYKDFLNFLVEHDGAAIFEVEDGEDFASYIYCMPETLADDAAWEKWLAEFNSR